METKQENFKRMFVITPEYYNKLLEKTEKQVKSLITDPLDKILNNIIQNKNMDPYQKYMLYNNTLLKFKIKNSKNPLEKDNNNNEKVGIKKEVEDAETNTSTQTIELETPTTTNNKNIQPNESWLFDDWDVFLRAMDTGNPNESIENFPPKDENPHQEEVFEFSPEQNKNQDENQDNSLINEEVETVLYNIARNSLGVTNDTQLFRHDNTLNNNFRVFENRETRDMLAIEVEPVQQHILTNAELDFMHFEQPRKDVSPPARKKLDFGASNFVENEEPKELEKTPKYMVLRNREIKRRRSSSISRLRYNKAQPPKKKTKNI